ncbi:acyl-CoA dehydrogenase [Streptomyces sp. NPDC057249]|uniref:acyl-CoA dehydrogenase n=1 Tax=Streptomyces sp. NPDC057249 TaxID=3346067 RepID=UPI00362F793A
MSHYKSHLRDLEFNLFEVLGRARAYGRGPFAGTTPETARDILAAVERLAVHELADSAVEADRNPPMYDRAERTVTLPEAFKKAYARWTDSGWHLLDLPESLGGAGVPPSLRWAVAELVLGANPALYMYQSTAGFAKILDRLGTPGQRGLARLLVERGWGATMVLTEPEAGSDVGACRTRAVPQPDGTWHIEGVKRFITSGEHDLAENILHFVLARPEGAGPGTKGLSLFLVPKYRPADLTGEPGPRNGVFATALEDKMGLKASATCELVFGAGEPAVGMLLGERHDGIRQMFHIIEQARMIIGTKSMATLSSAYRNALAYAKSRTQGADLTALADKSAPRVPILRHPDMRRSLLLQKGYAEGLRALVLHTAAVQDRIAEAEAAGTRDDAAHALNDLLLPIVKGYGSERACEQLGHALQTLGGAGYTQDFPMEQYIRDTRIDTLYEGTTAIQGMDLFFRKIARDQGGALSALLDEVRATAAGTPEDGTLAHAHTLLARAADHLQAMATGLGGHLLASLEDPQAAYQVGRGTTRLLMAAGDVLLAWLLLRQAGVATRLLADPATAGSGAQRSFYRGKVATAAFFAAEVLPLVAAQREIADRDDAVLMTLDEDAW